MPRGTDGSTANSITKCTEPAADRTTKATASGHASIVTEPGTPDPSFRFFNDEQAREFLRLQKVRKCGQMLTMTECDWLLDLYWRLKK
jgi:hypothetical protein